MHIENSKKIILALVLIILSVTSFAFRVNAEDFVIQGNGAGTLNDVNVNTNTNTNVQQRNSSNVNNNIDANANTGGNNASENTGGNTTIRTGNASVNVSVNNNLNNNSAVVNCCTPTPKKPTSPPGGPTATPGPGGRGDGKVSGDGGGGGGGVGGPSGQGQVLGLAPTSGYDSSSLFYTLGVLCLGVGGAILGGQKRLAR